MIINYIKSNFSTEVLDTIKFDSVFTKSFLRAMERSLVFNNNNTGLNVFSKIDPQATSLLTFQLDRLGLTTSEVSRNYNNISFNLQLLDQGLLQDYRNLEKIREYTLRLDTTIYPDNLTKVNGKLINTGLVRPGFAKVAKQEFQFDTKYLEKYRRPILQNMIKSITKSVDKGTIKSKFFDDEANYMEIAGLLLDHYILNPEDRYNLERNNGERRGRSNLLAQKRIGNPITYKDFRASLKVAGSKIIYQDDKTSLDAIYYFIAELVGNQGKTEDEVIQAGRHAYETKHLPRLDLKSEKGRKKLHELIWLERIYSKLDNLFSKAGARIGVLWDIPLEIDARMCVAQFYGALSNDLPTLESVCLRGDTINDPWYTPGVPRDVAKLLVAVLYGSSATSRALMRSKGIEADPKLVKAMNALRQTGRFAVMEAFKDALICDYNTHSPVIRVKLWKQEFDIHINKFTTHGTAPVATQAYDSKSKKFKTSITHEPIKVPDYGRMKLFWATCCVHGLESQVFDQLANEEPEWCITNHDAVICMPWNAKRIRQNYAKKIKEVNRDRFQIIRDFRQSIGAITPKSDLAFYKLFKLVKDAGDLEFNATAMK